MPALIDWHSHHTAPELVAEYAAAGSIGPRPDAEDTADFAQRVRAMDAAGIERQIVSLPAGLDPDRLPAEQAMAFARTANDLMAQRIEPFAGRLMGSIAISLQDISGSVAELERMARRGFSAVLMLAKGPLVARRETRPLFSKIADLGLPIFLHGSGARGGDESLRELEDEGQGVVVSAHADAAVTDCVARMIAAGIFDSPSSPRVVIRSGGGGIPLLLGKLWWKHKGADGERRYSDILLDHFLVDTAGVNVTTLRFLIDTMGEANVVFGSDYGGGLGPLEKALRPIEQHPSPAWVIELTERNSRQLLRL